jgi:hypothetical protein
MDQNGYDHEVYLQQFNFHSFLSQSKGATLLYGSHMAVTNLGNDLLNQGKLF